MDLLSLKQTGGLPSVRVRGSGMFIRLILGASNYSFEPRLRARHCSRHWEHRREQSNNIAGKMSSEVGEPEPCSPKFKGTWRLQLTGPGPSDAGSMEAGRMGRGVF